MEGGRDCSPKQCFKLKAGLLWPDFFKEELKKSIFLCKLFQFLSIGWNNKLVRTDALWTRLNFPLGWIQLGVTNLQPLDKINLEIHSRDRMLWPWELPVEYLLGVTATLSWEKSQRASGCLSHTVPGSCYLASVQLFHRLSRRRLRSCLLYWEAALIQQLLLLVLVLSSGANSTSLTGSCRLRWPPPTPHTCRQLFPGQSPGCGRS